MRRPRKGALALLSKGRQTELKAVMAATYYRHGVTRIPLAQMGSIDVLTAHPTTAAVLEEMWMNEFASLNRGSDVARLQDKNLAVDDFESKVGGLLRNALGSILDDFWHQAWRRERRAFPSYRTRAEIQTVEPRPQRTPVAPTPDSRPRHHTGERDKKDTNQTWVNLRPIILGRFASRDPGPLLMCRDARNHSVYILHQDARQRLQSAPPRLCDAETKKHNTKVRRPRKVALALLSKGRQTELKAVMAETYYRHGVTRITLVQMGSINVLTAHPTTAAVLEEMWMNEFASLNRGSDAARLQDKNLAVEDFESKVGGLLRNALGSILDDFSVSYTHLTLPTKA